MSNEKKRQSLGRGLSALLPTGSGSTKSSNSSSFMKTEPGEKVLMLPIEQIVRDTEQPRENFDEVELATLAASIRENGLIQPIIVRRSGDQYKIIAGERRWRATQMAGVKEISAIVRNIGQEQSAILALVENLHRANLNPIEEAKGYQRLLEDYGKTHEEIAEKVGKDRSSITNSLRLLTLPEMVQNALIEKKLNIGHAKVLLSLDNAVSIIDAAQEVVFKGLSVRATEQLVARIKSGKTSAGKVKKSSKNQVEKNTTPQIRFMTEQLQRALGTKTQIIEMDKTTGRGQIEIQYFSLDDLERILNKLIPERER